MRRTFVMGLLLTSFAVGCGSADNLQSTENQLHENMALPKQDVKIEDSIYESTEDEPSVAVPSKNKSETETETVNSSNEKLIVLLNRENSTSLTEKESNLSELLSFSQPEDNEPSENEFENSGASEEVSFNKEFGKKDCCKYKNHHKHMAKMKRDKHGNGKKGTVGNPRSPGSPDGSERVD